MKYKIKGNKNAFYSVTDWLDSYDFLNTKQHFCLIDWNQWDYDSGKIKDMYIETLDKKFDLIFNLSLSEHIESTIE